MYTKWQFVSTIDTCHCFGSVRWEVSSSHYTGTRGCDLSGACIVLGSRHSSAVRVLDLWSKGCGFECQQRRQQTFLLQGQLSVLTFISVSIPPLCCHSSVCRGAVWGIEGKQAGSMDEETQVRGCYNITFICTPPTRKQCLFEKTQANKTFRTWKQM